LLAYHALFAWSPDTRLGMSARRGCLIIAGILIIAKAVQLSGR
jgi:hypothetical protein